MIRRRLVVAFSTVLLLLVALVCVAAVIGVTQTSWGRAKVRLLVLAELGRAAHGRVYIGTLSVRCSRTSRWTRWRSEIRPVRSW